jgi:hypothetical protein
MPVSCIDFGYDFEQATSNVEASRPVTLCGRCHEFVVELIHLSVCLSGCMAALWQFSPTWQAIPANHDN